MDKNTEKIRTCLDEFEESEVWKRPNPHSNSVGNLILHLSGNIRQWIISSLGNVQDVRERDKEFSSDSGYTKQELFQKLSLTVEEAKKVLKNISTEEILKKRKIQGNVHSGIAVIIRVTEHYSYHTGQIIFWTKLLKDKDLGFYSGVNLNAKNEIQN
jgi:uncharacterized protein DUF1572